jgi:hypothetical protein
MAQQSNRSSQVAVNLAELLTRVDNDHPVLCELRPYPVGCLREHSNARDMR